VLISDHNVADSMRCVGYGDIVPNNYKAVFATYFLISVITFTYVLGESVAIVVDVLRWQRIMRILSEGVTQPLLDRMDTSHDGQVRLPEQLGGMVRARHPEGRRPRLLPKQWADRPCHDVAEVAESTVKWSVQHDLQRACMQICKVEFMKFMLEELDLVDSEEFHRILEVFDAVDINSDGVLNCEDVRRRLRESDGDDAEGTEAGPSV
jgi:hypothetical protein